MNALRTAAMLTLALALTTSCTSFRAYEKAANEEKAKNWDQAVEDYTRALAVDPNNSKYQAGLQRARLEASRGHFERGKALRAAGQNEAAAVELELTTRLDPSNQYAAVELAHALDSIRQAQHSRDKASAEEMKKRTITKAQPPQLNPASSEPISLSFPRDTPVKDIYKALGSAFGINVLFDQAVKDDRIAIELHDVTAQRALERVMQAAGHFYKVLDEKTIIVVPDNPQQRRDYEDLVIRTFYLSNGDAEQVTNVVRTMIEARNVFPLKALNAITIRDTADKVRIAEKIIQANDKAKAEVVVDLELLQLDMNKVRDLGAQLSAYTVGQGIATKDANGNTVFNSAPLTLEAIRSLTSKSYAFTVPTVTYNFIKNSTNAEQLANPELRISEGEKATLHIGDRIPVPVASFQSLGSASPGGFGPVTSFQYQDVGIKVTMEPRVHHNHEVTLKLAVEVSDHTGDVPVPGSSPQPIISTRTIESTIRLKDGETNFLAGLIQKSNSSTEDRIPFLGDVPVIGRIFNHDRKQQKRTDLVLTMTPHIIRIPDITEDDEAPMWVGTTNNLTFRGVSPRIESQAPGDPFMPRIPANLPQSQAPGTSSNPFTGMPVPGTVTPGTTMPTPGTTPAGPGPGTAAPGTTPMPITPPVGTPPSSPFKPSAQLTTPSDSTSLTEAAIVAARESLAAGVAAAQGTAPGQTAPAMKAVAAAAVPTSDSAAARVDDAPLRLSPRLSPQPVNVGLKQGEERTWEVIGMDLDGLNAAEMLLHFDPRTVDVSAVALGPALVFDPRTPPAAVVSRDSGTVRIASSDGHPLLFQGGGDVVTLRVRAIAPGETFLVVECPTLTNSRGEVVPATISGGRAKVE
jgi:general secretion pathway protein D